MKNPSILIGDGREKPKDQESKKKSFKCSLRLNRFNTKYFVEQNL